jgi:hypothetical protein
VKWRSSASYPYAAHSSGTTGISPTSAFCFSTRSSPAAPRTCRLKNSLSPESRLFHDIEYSGPSSSAERRSPAPTKLHDVVASPMTWCPPAASNSTRTLAKSSAGARA